MKPMLCHSVDLSEVDRLINDNNWWAQQKLDGDRLMVEVEDHKATVLNRNGEPYRQRPVPQRVLREFEVLAGKWCFDGELMDDGTLWLFDMPRAGYRIWQSTNFDTRSTVLDACFVLWNPAPCIRLLPTVRTTEAKRELFERLRADQCEGMVFKRIDGMYRSGKRSQAALKAKFTNTADCVVKAVRPEGRENCTLVLFRDGTEVPVGSVSLVGRPSVYPGDVIEVRYLYAGNDHKLVQPVMLRRRDDKSASACSLDQLHYTCRDVVAVERKFTFRGVGRRGTHTTGTFTEDPGTFVEARYQRRWQFLEIMDELGEHVGGIQPHPDTGKRVWWVGVAS